MFLPVSSSMWMRVRCTAFGARLRLDVDHAAEADRQLVLADLIALGQVGIEVVLARPAALRRDVQCAAKPGAQRELDGAAVEHRQRPGHARQTGQVF